MAHTRQCHVAKAIDLRALFPFQLCLAFKCSFLCHSPRVSDMCLLSFFRWGQTMCAVSTCGTSEVSLCSFLHVGQSKRWIWLKNKKDGVQLKLACSVSLETTICFMIWALLCRYGGLIGAQHNDIFAHKAKVAFEKCKYTINALGWILLFSHCILCNFEMIVSCVLCSSSGALNENVTRNQYAVDFSRDRGRNNSKKTPCNQIALLSCVATKHFCGWICGGVKSCSIHSNQKVQDELYTAV